MIDLTIDEITKNRMTWAEVIRHYNPDATDEECEFILWEKTPFPMSSIGTLSAIKKLFKPSN